MAGLGSRMKDAGYTDSKPMIPVLGRTMIQIVVDMLQLPPDATLHFIAQEIDIERYDLKEYLPSICGNREVFVHSIVGLTEGAACTVLSIEKFINTDVPLALVNSDQEIEWLDDPWNIPHEADGVIYTFKADCPKFSYAKTVDNRVTEVAEKKVISEDATAGLYYFKKGSDYVEAANKMIEQDKRVNNEFYNAPVYNEMLDLNIIIKEVKEVHHLGTPEELEYYVSQRS